MLTPTSAGCRAPPPPSGVRDAQAVPAAAERVLATSRTPRSYFLLNADGFEETCLSFDIASLSLMWALKACDRASTALSGEFAKGTWITVDSGRSSSSLGGDGRLVLGSPAPSLSRPEGRRRVGTGVPGGSGPARPQQCLPR